MATTPNESQELRDRLARAREDLARAHEDMAVVMRDVGELAPGMKTSVMHIIERVFDKLQNAEREVTDASTLVESRRGDVLERRRASDRAVSLRLFDLAGNEVSRQGSLAAEPPAIAWHDHSYYLESPEPRIEGDTRVFVYRATRPG